MPDRILVTGGAGKTGSLVAERLAANGTKVRVASRRPSSTDQVRFDWEDPATFDAALADVSSIYLVAPTDQIEHLAVMRPFLEQAVARARGRLVLLSASSLPIDGPMMGEVHAWLSDHAPQWTVLRPSWFMQNFTTQHRFTILNEGCVYSATQSGRVPFIDAADIAAVAVRALTDPALTSGELILTGPDAISYDEAAQAIAEVVGRPIRHRRLSADELAARYRSFGVPAPYALLLAGMDEAIANGAEDRTTTAVPMLIGRPATTFARFLIGHRAAFDHDMGSLAN